MHEHKTIYDVQWFIDAGDGRTFLRARYGDQDVIVLSTKRTLLDANIVHVQGLDLDDYDEGLLDLGDGKPPWTYDKHQHLVESAQLALEVEAMADAFMSSPSPLHDPRFKLVGMSSL